MQVTAILTFFMSYSSLKNAFYLHLHATVISFTNTQPDGQWGANAEFYIKFSIEYDPSYLTNMDSGGMDDHKIRREETKENKHVLHHTET
jgi:hypothetical protein